MSADREDLIQLFDAKVQSFEAPKGARFIALLPFKEGIVRLRAKRASCRTIVGLLKELGVTVSHNTVARFCRELCASAGPNGSGRIAAKQAAPITPKPQATAVAELLNRRHESGKTPEPPSSPRGRGPRIADPKNV